jgi:hypothetical protein
MKNWCSMTVFDKKKKKQEREKHQESTQDLHFVKLILTYRLGFYLEDLAQLKYPTGSF